MVWLGDRAVYQAPYLFLRTCKTPKALLKHSKVLMLRTSFYAHGFGRRQRPKTFA